MPTNHNLIRVLIADDEAKIRDAYREVFEDPRLSSGRTMIQNLRAKVLGASQADPSAIPIAEATGMIFPIGEWVMRTACAQQRAWTDEGLPSIHMAVNVSACQFTRADFPSLVLTIIQDTGINPAALELEITESALMNDEARSMKTLQELKALGVMLSIDDFGTGYSNLARLREFPVDRLKIDRSFVAHIATRSSDSTIAEAIIAMAKTLKLDVVAEGVEDFQQLLQLQEHQCHLAQGYLLSRPLRAADARQLLARLAAQMEGTRTQRLQRLIG